MNTAEKFNWDPTFSIKPYYKSGIYLYIYIGGKFLKSSIGARIAFYTYCNIMNDTDMYIRQLKIQAHSEVLAYMFRSYKSVLLRTVLIKYYQ